MLIAFGYKRRTGKDTASDILVRDYGFTKLGFAAPIRTALETMFGFTYEQIYGSEKEVVDEHLGFTPRRAAQVLGDAVRDNLAEDAFTRILEKRIPGNTDIVIHDIRTISEARWVADNDGALCLMKRDTEDNDSHKTETQLDDFEDWDFVIDNNGSMEDLRIRLDEIMVEIADIPPLYGEVVPC
jgi:hypothetical protein